MSSSDRDTNETSQKKRIK